MAQMLVMVDHEAVFCATGAKDFEKIVERFWPAGRKKRPVGAIDREQDRLEDAGRISGLTNRTAYPDRSGAPALTGRHTVVLRSLS